MVTQYRCVTKFDKRATKVGFFYNWMGRKVVF